MGRDGANMWWMILWQFILILSAILSGDIGGATKVELNGPQLRQFPHSLTHFSNSVGLTLSCWGQGPPPLIISWLGETGEELPQIPGIREQLQNGSLHFSPFPPEHFIPTVHAGAYRCSVRNPVGTFLSPVFRVRAILDEPFDVAIKTNGEWVEGSPALLECEVSPDYYAPFVRAVGWKEINQFGQEREIQIESESNYQMSCDGSLLILAASVQQLFVCIAQNRLNRRIVASPPFLLKSRRNPPGSGGHMGPKSILSKQVSCGSSSSHGQGGGLEDDSKPHPGMDGKINRADLLCLGAGNPRPTFRWERHVPTLSIGGGSSSFGGTSKVIQLGSTGPLLQVGAASANNNETYLCEAHNAFGSYSLNYSISGPGEHNALILKNVSVEPRRILAKNGQTVEFTCRMGQGKDNNNGVAYSSLARSTEELKWFKDGKPLPATEGARFRVANQKLFIFNPRLGDQGVYQCFSKDQGATGGGTLLFPPSAPELVQSFISQSLQPGPSLSLKCSAVGNPPPVISWEVDGLNLSESSSSSSGFHHSQHSRYSIGGDAGGSSQREAGMTVSFLNISEVRVEDSGEFKCSASNLVDSASHGARLNVYGPIFVKEMGALTLVHGESARIPCHYGGFPVDKVVWEKDSQPIIGIEKWSGSGSTTPTRFSLLANGSLQIGRISTETDKGRYTCRVFRKGEVATGSVHVNVMRPPVISQFKFDSDLKEGQRTSATCNVISGDPPIVIGWWKDGQPIPKKLNVTENRVRFISFLIFDELREEHNGEYACSASNAAAVVRLSAKLEVRVPPKWTKVPENSKVILKSDHSLSCSAKGVPSPTMTWFMEINGIKTMLRNSHKYALGQDGTLKILSVEERDSSTYICEAANGIGSSISQSIRVDVIIPAKITASQPSILVAEGGPASLQCQIRGDRPVEVVWKKNSTVIPFQPPSQLAYQSGSGRKVLFQKVIELNESVLSAQLEIEQSEMNDSGVYICLASNQYGRDEDRINLQVKARPTPPENFIVEEIGSRFIRLRWSKPQPKSNVPITQFILEWRNSPSFALPVWKDSLSGSGQAFNMSVLFPQTQAVIEGLIPVTNYQVRLSAWNDIGGSLPTEPLTVLTLAEAPSGPPRNVSGVPLSSKSLLVKWEPPEPDFQHGAILGYQVTAQLQAYSSSIGNGTVTVDQKWDQQSEVKGLRPNSPYRISVLAYNSAGMGPESLPFFIQTPEGAPDSPPLNLQCEALSPKSLQVQWEPPPAHLSNGQILGYKVIYIPAQLGMMMQGSRLGEKPEVKKTSNRETTLHGLRSYTSYAVRILAYTAGGESETSKPVECTTEEDVPEEPADIKVLMTSATSVLVSWLPPHSPNGAITKYTIFWKSDETGVVKEKQYVPLALPSSQDHQPSFEIRKLKDGQKYSFWITASTNAGLGKASRTEVVQLSSPLVTKFGARIASFPVNRNVLKDKSIRLSCKAVGSPPPKLSWFKNGQPIHSNGLLRNGSLFISRIKNEDEGEYICRAENELGLDELPHGIIISRPPSAIQIFVGYVTDTSIQIHWEPPEKADPPMTGYLLEYRRSHEVLHEWQSMRLDNLLTSYSLEGLLCGAHYELRLAAENAVGRGEFSEVAKARTNGAAPESSPRLTEILDGNWTMIRADLNRWPDGGCPVTSFQIEFRKEGDQEWRRIYRRDNATRVFNIQTQPEGKYQIKIWVANDAGSVMKTFLIEAHPDFFLNYAKVLERVEEEEKLNGGSSYIPFYTDPHVLVPIVSAVICTAAITVCVLMLIKRKKQSKPGGWKYNSGSNQQSWLSSSDQQSKSGCGGDGGSSKYGTEECMSIYATLNSTKPIPMTIRDSTVRLQSFGQHDNYDAPPSLLSRKDSGSRDQLKKSRRKSKSLSSPLEEVCLEQVSCDMEFSSKIEPPREFRSSTSIASQQQHHHNLQLYGRSPHQSQPNHMSSSSHTFGHNSSEDEDEDHNQEHANVGDNDNGRRLSRYSAGDDEMLYHDYSCPYQFGGEQAGKAANRQGTLTKKRNAEARNKSRKYFD